MNIKNILLIIFSALGISAYANQPAIIKANDLYVKGKYQEAIVLYEGALRNEGVSSELYYNLGNAYYKSSHLGKAVLCYERSLVLNPNYEDAKYNLDFVQLKVKENILHIPPFFLMRWFQVFVSYLTPNQWFWVGWSFLVVGLLTVLIFIFGSTHRLRKAHFYISVVLILLTVVCLSFSELHQRQLENHESAIVMVDSVSLKSSPDQSGTDVLKLYEGTKVILVSTLGNWVEVKLGSGLKGWIQLSTIERI